MTRRRALGCCCAASSFARLSGGRLIQSLSRRPPRQSLRRSGPPRRRSMSGGATGTSETVPMMCLMPAYIGTFADHIMVLPRSALLPTTAANIALLQPRRYTFAVRGAPSF